MLNGVQRNPDVQPVRKPISLRNVGRLEKRARSRHIFVRVLRRIPIVVVVFPRRPLQASGQLAAIIARTTLSTSVNVSEYRLTIIAPSDGSTAKRGGNLLSPTVLKTLFKRGAVMAC